MARRKYTINALTGDGIDEAIRGVREYQRWIERKTGELFRRCAAIGATVASIKFSRAIYTGKKDVSVSVEEIPNGYVVKADGETALILEFGAGFTYGYGHPEASQHGMGPGTYPDGKGHWNDPNGWWIPKSAGGGHTYGNPPEMPMYEARKEIQQRLTEIVREVFSS